MRVALCGVPASLLVPKKGVLSGVYYCTVFTKGQVVSVVMAGARRLRANTDDKRKQLEASQRHLPQLYMKD